MAETKWYVLRAISGQEKKVKTYMENELARQGLSDSVPQILIPTEKIYEIRKGKKVIRFRCGSNMETNCLREKINIQNA